MPRGLAPRGDPISTSEDGDEDGSKGDSSDDDDEPGGTKRRVRSTRRRQDTPDLPRLPIEHRTVGRAFRTPSGRTYRPSMFATFTLPSYGRVRSDGTPFDPDRYDYRRAALDALHFSKLVDRLWQNLRQAGGSSVAEPSPFGRLQGAVLRGRRAAAAPGSPPPYRSPRRDPPRDVPPGARGHLPPGVVASV
jgi:hypothetical protein